jgi:hypothetical protein
MILINEIYMNLFNNLILNLNIIELKCLWKLTKLYLKLGKNKLNYKSIHF